MATHDLGELGTTRPPVDMTFQWFGETIRVSPTASDLGLIDFLEMASTIDTRDKVSAMVATRNYLHGQIDERDWPRVLELAVQHNQQFGDLLSLARSIVEAVAVFPTGRLSDSSDGQPSTNPRSRDAYSSAVATAMAASKGRPDVKMIIWEAHKARMARAAQAA